MTEQQWKASYEAYKTALPANRAAYKAIREDAPVEASEFDRLVRAEVDIDCAGNDSGEWVRAAREVADRLWTEWNNSQNWGYTECYGYEPDSDHEHRLRVEQVARENSNYLATLNMDEEHEYLWG
jgi:hypothetical protein